MAELVNANDSDDRRWNKWSSFNQNIIRVNTVIIRMCTSVYTVFQLKLSAYLSICKRHMLNFLIIMIAHVYGFWPKPIDSIETRHKRKYRSKIILFGLINEITKKKKLLKYISLNSWCCIRER